MAARAMGDCSRALQAGLPGMLCVFCMAFTMQTGRLQPGHPAVKHMQHPREPAFPQLICQIYSALHTSASRRCSKMGTT